LGVLPFFGVKRPFARPVRKLCAHAKQSQKESPNEGNSKVIHNAKEFLSFLRRSFFIVRT
jgi:hypothetical protein